MSTENTHGSEFADPHHDGDVSWKWEGGKLFQKHVGQSKWVEAKRVHATPARIRALAAALPTTPPPLAGEGGEAVLGTGDFYGSGTDLPQLHDDPLTSREIQVQALCARLDTARQALAACAAMQVVTPVLRQIKDNAAWAMNETNPSRVLPRSAATLAPSQGTAVKGKLEAGYWGSHGYKSAFGIPLVRNGYGYSPQYVAGYNKALRSVRDAAEAGVNLEGDALASPAVRDEMPTADARDAARYRWLRDEHREFVAQFWPANFADGGVVDERIDTAMGRTHQKVAAAGDEKND